MKEFEIRTLKNGLRLVHKPLKNAVSHFGVILHCGSRDEREDEFGLAHFIEHTIFKGTKKRKAYHVLNRLDSVGGELNAYTSKEETVLYGSFLNTYYKRTIELFADIIYNSTFPSKEIEKEKAVIIDEIYSYQDSPSEQIFDDFEDLIYENHSLGHNILGTEESVNTFNKTHIQQFVKRNFTLDNLVICSAGKINIDRLERLCNEYFGDHKIAEKGIERTPFKLYTPKHITAKKDTHQAHFMLGNIAAANTSEQKTATILLNNLLGGPGMNSLLSLELRERFGISYNIESNYQPYSDTGVFQIYLGTDAQTLAKGKKVLEGILKKLRDKSLGTMQLHSAKKQLAGQYLLSQENNSQAMLSLGKSLLVYGSIDSDLEIIKKIMEVSAQDLLEVANTLLAPDKMSSIIYN